MTFNLKHYREKNTYLLFPMLLLVMAASLLPYALLGQKSNGQSFLEICGANGIKLVAVDDQQILPDSTPSNKHNTAPGSPHCPFCLLRTLVALPLQDTTLTPLVLLSYISSPLAPYSFVISGKAQYRAHAPRAPPHSA